MDVSRPASTRKPILTLRQVRDRLKRARERGEVGPEFALSAAISRTRADLQSVLSVGRCSMDSMGYLGRVED